MKIQVARLNALALVALCAATFVARASNILPISRWKIAADDGIVWQVAPGDVHQDFVEMNGEQVALVIRYGVNPKGTFTVNHDVVWPMLRLQPNLTDSHLMMSFGEDASSEQDPRFRQALFPPIQVRVDQEWWPLEKRILSRVHLKGTSRFEGWFGNRDEPPRLAFRREIFPSVDKPAAIDTTTIANVSTKNVELSIDDFEQTSETPVEQGVYGAYRVTERVIGAGYHRLHPGESLDVTVIIEAHKQGDPLLKLDVAAEEKARKHRIERILDRMQLQTPDPILDTAFAFAKFHTSESIFRTRGGLLHSPGGLRYYAAIWANDQAEYTNPFFGMLGDPIASEAAINSFRQFARYLNPQYRPIPSSIISEGAGFWNGAGDRGDMAMIAYGAARFALAYGNKQTARELWPLVQWCLKYLSRRVTARGVVVSDSDELEGRFPAGKANLNTSSLYYDALRSAAMLGRALSKNKTEVDDYERRAVAVHNAIERYFEAKVAGFETYRYYDKAELRGDPRPEVAAYAREPDVLRAWIATPLTMDIFDRVPGTIDALFSPRMWTADGLATEAGQVTYWDRATLYALRGVLAAGATERGLEHLKEYSNRRLLGDHVPYPIEAYPEGGKAQLAAESALYCRIFTEGLFGIRPTSLRSFTLRPRLPDGWASMALRKVHAFGDVFDLEIARTGSEKVTATLIRAGRTNQSYLLDSTASITVTLDP